MGAAILGVYLIAILWGEASLVIGAVFTGIRFLITAEGGILWHIFQGILGLVIGAISGLIIGELFLLFLVFILFEVLVLKEKLLGHPSEKRIIVEGVSQVDTEKEGKNVHQNAHPRKHQKAKHAQKTS